MKEVWLTVEPARNRGKQKLLVAVKSLLDSYESPAMSPGRFSEGGAVFKQLVLNEMGDLQIEAPLIEKDFRVHWRECH